MNYNKKLIVEFSLVPLTRREGEQDEVVTGTHGDGNGGVKELCVDRAGVVASGGGVQDLDLNLTEIRGEGQE